MSLKWERWESFVKNQDSETELGNEGVCPQTAWHWCKALWGSASFYRELFTRSSKKLKTGSLIKASSNPCCRRRQWHPTPVLLPGKSHGWRRLVGCSPRGREESDITERLHFHFSLSCIGEGNGNPLQCSCLENPRDGRALWAAATGVAQSRTQLKRLSSI